MLHAWYFRAERQTGADAEPPPPEEFTRLTRDLYVAAGDVGFWQGTFRDPRSPEFAAARRSIEARRPMTVDVLYGDLEGDQRTITRFNFMPYPEGEDWHVAVSRHWSLDRPGPR